MASISDIVDISEALIADISETHNYWHFRKSLLLAIRETIIAGIFKVSIAGISETYDC